MSHYDETYFSWQKALGEFGGAANLLKFANYIQPHDVVLDFGCGGGYLLSNIRCARKVGVEINPDARQQSARAGIEVFGSLAELPDHSIDVAISNHALEHVHHPLGEIASLVKKLKPGGLAIFVVPCENVWHRFEANDVNQHLFSWGPMCLGNLFAAAGFEVLESKRYVHTWPRGFRAIQRWFGWRVFHIVCRIYGAFSFGVGQVRIVARTAERHG